MAYAIWSALGTALITTIGVLWFHEPVTALKVFSLVAIIGGVVGLYLSGGVHSGMGPLEHSRAPLCSRYCFIIANVRRFSLRMGRTIIGRSGASTPEL